MLFVIFKNTMHWYSNEAHKQDQNFRVEVLALLTGVLICLSGQSASVSKPTGIVQDKQWGPKIDINYEQSLLNDEKLYDGPDAICKLWHYYKATGQRDKIWSALDKLINPKSGGSCGTFIRQMKSLAVRGLCSDLQERKEHELYDICALFATDLVDRPDTDPNVYLLLSKEETQLIRYGWRPTAEAKNWNFIVNPLMYEGSSEPLSIGLRSDKHQSLFALKGRKNIVRADLEFPLQNADFQAIDSWDGLRELVIRPEELPFLGRKTLRRLTTLTVTGPSNNEKFQNYITIEGLKAINSCPNLEFLIISNCMLPDQINTAEELVSPSLYSLVLENTGKYTGQFLNRGMPKLEYLQVRGATTTIEDRGLETICKLPHLRSLQIQSLGLPTGISIVERKKYLDAVYSKLSLLNGSKSLQFINFPRTDDADEWLPYMTGLKSIRTIDLSLAGTTKNSFVSLSQMNGLQSIIASDWRRKYEGHEGHLISDN